MTEVDGVLCDREGIEVSRSRSGWLDEGEDRRSVMTQERPARRRSAPLDLIRTTNGSGGVARAPRLIFGRAAERQDRVCEFGGGHDPALALEQECYVVPKRGQLREALPPTPCAV